jgi:hypothetical protein
MNRQQKRAAERQMKKSEKKQAKQNVAYSYLPPAFAFTVHDGGANASKSNASLSKVGNHPEDGILSNDQLELNGIAVEKFISDYRNKFYKALETGGLASFPTYHNPNNSSTINVMDRNQISLQDLQDVCIALVKSQLAKEEGQAKGSASYPYYTPSSEIAYWNTGMFGSIWLDIKVPSGKEYRLSMISNDEGKQYICINK